MGGGICIGLLLYPILGKIDLKRLFGLLVTIYAARELFIELRPQLRISRQLSPFWSTFWFVLAGIHPRHLCNRRPHAGVRGGPSRTGQGSIPRHHACWSGACSHLSFHGFSDQRPHGGRKLKITAGLLPVLAVGILFGEWVHDKVSERIFRRLIFCLLLFSGVMLMI